ncbi:MAG: DNA topoisomerase III, partial [Prevotella sp.]|nr:DNA topoisomerase III [Prevotella sp.]
LIPTDMGVSLIDTIRTDLLKSPELTGLWEKKLREIEDGHYNPALFMEELKQQLKGIIDTVINDIYTSTIISVKGDYAKPGSQRGTRAYGKRHNKKR